LGGLVMSMERKNMNRKVDVFIHELFGGCVVLCAMRERGCGII